MRLILSAKSIERMVCFGLPTLIGGLIILSYSSTYAYPPAVGILGKSRNCLACHENNGSWKDDEMTIIDILDKESKKSLRQKDGSFIISAKRGETKTVLTVLGRAKGDKEEAPHRNAWLYIDPMRIKEDSVGSKFAPGWMINLPLSCRLVGDKLEGFDGANITALPMTLRPTDEAKDAEVELQVMFTKGEAVKGDAKKGMVGSYFERKIKLEVGKEEMK